MAFSPYCPTSIFGYPILFPHLNFPLFLFALHHYVLHTHKEHERIIYEVIDEDIYVYVKRYQCLNSEDCPRYSNVYTLTTRPSLAARNIGLSVSGNVRRIESFRDLDAWLQEKMRTAIPPPEEKNIYY
uniref:Uncharacterized protein n=1 Tax=Ascaris lumbricoides TaxID=6252 RepID=A0A9J2P0A3_ASCLU